MATTLFAFIIIRGISRSLHQNEKCLSGGNIVALEKRIFLHTKTALDVGRSGKSAVDTRMYNILYSLYECYSFIAPHIQYYDVFMFLRTLIFMGNCVFIHWRRNSFLSHWILQCFPGNKKMLFTSDSNFHNSITLELFLEQELATRALSTIRLLRDLSFWIFAKTLKFKIVFIMLMRINHVMLDHNSMTL